MAIAVVSEFNPFHNGHKYLIQKAKSVAQEPLIAVMSGSFTQRGEVAVTDKFQRAESALKSGADLVVELPTVYAVSNAQRFASCGVHIAKAFNSVNYLAFGCENDDAGLLSRSALALGDAKVQRLISEEMKAGCYYPKAVETAVRSVFGDETADLLRTPNNILAVEYMRCLKATSITPLPIMRKGTAHDSEVVSGEFASASQIRRLLRAGEDVKKYLPYAPKDITFPENLERIMLYKLRSMDAEEFRLLPDVNEGLENRIMNAVHNYNSVEEIISCVKTKRYTHARLRRIMTFALLGITEELQTTPVEYAGVLGFTKGGAELLRGCNLEVVTSVAKAMKSGGNVAKLLKKDVFATDIASLAYRTPKICGLDFTKNVIKI